MHIHLQSTCAKYCTVVAVAPCGLHSGCLWSHSTAPMFFSPPPHFFLQHCIHLHYCYTTPRGLHNINDWNWLTL